MDGWDKSRFKACLQYLKRRQNSKLGPFDLTEKKYYLKSDKIKFGIIQWEVKTLKNGSTL